MLDKDRQIEGQIADQKNQWAEIYGSQKEKVDKLNHEIQLLHSEKQALQKALDQRPSGGVP